MPSAPLRVTTSPAARGRRRRSLAGLLTVALLLLACGGDEGRVAWRDLSVDVPEGWEVFEDEDTRMGMSNVPMGDLADPDDPPEGEVLAIFFRHDPGIRPDDWRDYVADLDDVAVEQDDALELDDEVPATRLVFSYDNAGVPTREMVVIVPARGIEILAQPVPGPGDTDAPEVFLDNIETFMDAIASIEFGAPIE